MKPHKLQLKYFKCPFYLKANVQNSGCRKLLNLKHSRKSFYWYFHATSGKTFHTFINVKALNFEEDCSKLWAIIQFARLPVTDNINQSIQIKQSYKRSDNYFIYFCVSFDSDCQEITFERDTSLCLYHPNLSCPFHFLIYSDSYFLLLILNFLLCYTYSPVSLVENYLCKETHSMAKILCL